MKHQMIFSVIFLAAMLSGRLSAQSGVTEFVSFRDFINRTTTANPNEYVARPDSRLRDAAAFEEMRQHILAMYGGVE